jgi:hypothetical protein
MPTRSGAKPESSEMTSKVRLEHLLGMTLDAIIRGEQPDDQLTWSRIWSTGNLKYACPFSTQRPRWFTAKWLRSAEQTANLRDFHERLSTCTYACFHQ